MDTGNGPGGSESPDKDMILSPIDSTELNQKNLFMPGAAMQARLSS